MSARRTMMVLFSSLLWSMAPNSYSLQWKDLWWTPEQQGKLLMQQGQFKAAQAQFHDLEWRGVAAYRAGDYQKAAQHYQSLDTADSYYNQGNALVHLGRYKQALAAYDKVLTINSTHEDARYNRDKVKMYLEQNLEQAREDQKNTKNSQNHTNQENKQNQDNQEKQPNHENLESHSNSQDQKNVQDQKNAQEQQNPINPQKDGTKEAPAADQDSSNNIKREKQARDEAKQAAENKLKENNKSDTARKQPYDPSTEEKLPQNERQSAPQEATKNNKQMRNHDTKSDDAKPSGKDKLTTEEPEEKDHASLAQRQASEEEKHRQAQWLRLIPDDPGGLMREKFFREHQRREQQFYK